MLLRKLAKIIRGKATPFQLMSACILASLIGFTTGFATAGGLILCLLLLLVILNANLPLAALVGILAKLVSLLLMPVTFAVGKFLLTGPTESLFASLVNAPVFAWFGFEYYSTTGGLVTGFLFGLICGLMVTKSVNAYRRKMKDLEENSEKFKTYSQKGSVKAITWLLVGSAPKKVDFDALLAKKIGNPIRILGVVFAGLTLLLLYVGYSFAAQPIVTYGLRTGLETANGATVDLENAELNLNENRLTIQNLAMADPNALDTDLFRATELVADISGMQLLKKRMQLDKVIVTGGSSGEKRSSPGSLVGEPPEPEEEKDPVEIPDAKTLENYLKTAKEWKERLSQLRDWMRNIEASDSAEPEVNSESWQERLEREIRELGYAKVKAGHLIEGSPTFSVLELQANEVTAVKVPNEQFDISANNLSTHPSLLGRAPSVSVQSKSGKMGFTAQLGKVAGGTNSFNLHYLGLPVDDVARDLVVNGSQPISGGTIDLKLGGEMTFGANVLIDFPVQITLHDTTIAIAGMKPEPIKEFVLPVALRGPIDNPRVQVDDAQLKDALVQAGMSKLKEELGNKAQEEISKQLGEGAGEEGKKLLDGLFNRKQ